MGASRYREKTVNFPGKMFSIFWPMTPGERESPFL
jgi:hypothetical protein